MSPKKNTPFKPVRMNCPGECGGDIWIDSPSVSSIKDGARRKHYVGVCRGSCYIDDGKSPRTPKTFEVSLSEFKVAQIMMNLHRWQREFLAKYEESDKKDFLLVATPGSGKTRAGILAAKTTGLPVVAIGPNHSVLNQWKMEADIHGVPIKTHTYQSVMLNPKKFINMGPERFLILDEMHHSSQENQWGEKCMVAFEHYVKRLHMTGTPFRSDKDPIPFITYVGGWCAPDSAYSYGEAAAEGTVRRLTWPVYDGHIWYDDDSKYRLMDKVVKRIQRKNLLECLKPDSTFMRKMITEAHQKLKSLPKHPDRPRDGGLIIAHDIEDANEIGRFLSSDLKAKVVVVHERVDDPVGKIREFRAGTGQWLVCVRMVSEGVDIPRLRILVYATGYRTEMFFRQAMGRVVRMSDEDDNDPAICYVPHDPILGDYIARMHLERLHFVNKMKQDPGLGSGKNRPSNPRPKITPVATDGWEDRVEKLGIDWRPRNLDQVDKRPGAVQRDSRLARAQRLVAEG